MSQANTSDPPTAASTADLLALRDARNRAPSTCSYCDGPFPDGVDDDTNYCSRGCYIRGRGKAALNRIESDHTWCATCFRQIKEVEKPPWNFELKVPAPQHAGRGAENEVRDCLVGYQYPTEHMELAVDDFSSDPRRPLERQRWGCECGQVDPGERDAVLEAVDLQTTILSLHHCLDALAEKGALQESPSWPRMREALAEHGRDWEYVIGYALYG